MKDPEITKKIIEIDGVEFNIYKLGEGIPIFLIPAFHSDFDRLKPLCIALSPYFTVYLPELPGISTPYPLGNHKHNAENYARFLDKIILKLKLKNYFLGGICYSSLIVMRMLSLGNIRPKAVFLIESITDGKHIHLEPQYMPIYHLMAKLGPGNKFIERITDIFLHGRKLQKFFLMLKYRREKNLKKIIDHQIDLNMKMNSRAVLELVGEIYRSEISRENLRFDIPALLLHMKHDNILDNEKIIADLKKIFPNHDLHYVNFHKHAPAGPLSLEYAEDLIAPVLPDIRKFAQKH